MYFPFNNSPITDSSNPVIERMAKFWEYAYPVNQVYWVEADLDNRVYAGEVDVWNSMYPNIPIYRRNLFNFNRILRAVNMVEGRQRQHRTSIEGIPVEGSDEITADQFTKVIAHINQNNDMYETISDAFRDALISGMAYLEVWLDYRSDPINGDIRIDRLPYNSIIIDPYFRKADLSDCNGIWKRTYLTRAEVRSLLPKKKEQIDALNIHQGTDARFQFMPETYGFSKSSHLTYDEFYYRAYREQTLIVDTKTGDTFEWRSSDMDKLDLYMSTYPELEVQKNDIPTVRLSITVEGQVMYDGPIWMDDYPLVPVFCYFNPQIPYYNLRVQSLVRNARDAQYLYSRRKVIELDMLESRANTGWIYKEKALIDPKAVYYTGQGRSIALKESAQMTDITPIPQQTIDPSVFQMSEMLGNEMGQIMGINEELIGSANDDKAGVLAMLRQGAGLTTLQNIYDSLDRSQRILGRRLIRAIQTNYTPGKIQRILNEQPTQEFYNQMFGKYDCAIVDGVYTATQRQMQFAQLVELRGLGVNIPDDLLIQAATIQDKKDITDYMKQQQEAAQQAQQQQQQMLQAEQEARTNLANARATADQGLGMERISRIRENQALAVERRAEAEKDHFSAVLDFVKALKELEAMDIKNLQDLIAMTRIVSNVSREKEIGLPEQQAQGSLEQDFARMQAMQPQGQLPANQMPRLQGVQALQAPNALV